MASLPTELKLQILDCLDIAPPSEVKLAAEPSLDGFTASNEQPLKTLSLLSHEWRALCIPLLFRHVRLFLNLHCQTYHVKNSGSSALSRFTKFIACSNIQDCIESLVVLVDGDKSGNVVDTELLQYRPRRQENEIFWQAVLSIVPRLNRLAIMAPPLVLADLIHTCNNIWMTDAWAFDMPLKILQLRIDLPSKASASPKNVMDYENTPFFTHVRNMRFGGTQYCRSIVHTRPWTHVSVNEGSSLKAYSTYEYFHKKPPTVAPSLLSCFLAPGSQVLTHLSYVAIFPFRDHLQWFRRYLLPCNTIRSFCVQLAPLPASKLTDDPERLGKAQLGDCWLELERGYKDLCALIVSMDETSDLTNFESLDYENYELVQEDLRQAFAPLDAYGWHMVRGGLWRKTDSA